MKRISRRKFVKGLLTVLALAPMAGIIKEVPAMKDNAVLRVDKDGNATLHGVALVVDKKHNASVM